MKMFNLTEEEMSNFVVKIIRELARQKGYILVKQPPSEAVQAVKDSQVASMRERIAERRRKLISDSDK